MPVVYRHDLPADETLASADQLHHETIVVEASIQTPAISQMTHL
jgi:hypothetical protein